MLKKSTGELLTALSKASSIDEYIRNNEPYFIDQTISEHLIQLLDEKGLFKSEVIKKSELSDITAYHIFSGKRNPSRNTLLCIAIAMGLNEREIDGLLKLARFIPLYVKDKRDSIILFGIQQGKSVAEVNTLLYDTGEDTLG